MLTFDEFFKKKRVDLTALQKAEPSLFAEFKTHYEQMGEKSFDHTKKYWFNKTRRQYPLAPEVKTEKVHIANPIAEQTITESLTEHTPAFPSPKVGFTPKFRATTIAKPAAEIEKAALSAATPEPAPAAEAPAKPAGFVPRFKMKPKAETEETTPVEAPVAQADEAPVAKPAGFTPRFKMKPKAETEETTLAEASAPEPAEPVVAKPAGFTPRFKMKPKAESEETASNDTPAATQESAPIDEPAPQTTEPAAAKPAGFTPRFKMKPKAESEEEAPQPIIPPVIESPTTPETPEKKPAYKPRFVPPKTKE